MVACATISTDPKGPYMPAVTADTLTLPRIEAPTVLAQDRPLISLTTAPSGFRRRRLSCAPRFRRHSERCARPVHHDGPDGFSRLSAV